MSLLDNQKSGVAARDYRRSGARLYSDGKLKRGFDFVVGALLLLTFIPVFVATAVAVKLDSPGPIFYRQIRYGRSARPFRIIKFRTMRPEPYAAFRQAKADDHRVTAVGAILRKTSLDELPQLINVLFGQMALVGPRPHPLPLDAQYRDLIPHYDDRYLVRPGITGLAQISGARGETSTVAQMAQRIEHDLAYVSGSSLWMDLRILIATVAVVGSGTNAY